MKKVLILHFAQLNSIICTQDSISTNDVLKAQSLIEVIFDIIEKDENNGNTVLHHAAYFGKDEIVTALLHRKDIKINIRSDSEGQTALMPAATFGYFNICQALLKHGADPQIIDGRNCIASDYAKEYGHTKVVALLNSAQL